MPKRLRGKSVLLAPNLRFGDTKAMARCKNAWKQLFELLYEHQIDAESVSAFHWHVDVGNASVQLVPIPAYDVVGSDLWTAEPVFRFGIDEFLPELKKLKGPKNASARTKLNRQLRNWIANAVVESFQSEPIQVEYSWFNKENHSFSTSITMTADRKTGKPMLLWSNTRRYKPLPKKKEVKKKPAKEKPDYSNGWQRFYFDDGDSPILVRPVQGYDTYHCSGRPRDERQIEHEDTEDSEGCPSRRPAGDRRQGDRRLRRVRPKRRTLCAKRRCSRERIKRELSQYEKKRGLRIPEQYRQHVLTVNGGDFSGIKKGVQAHVSLPAHPTLDKMEVHNILGFATKNERQNITEESTRTVFADGHVPCAQAYFPFTIDQQGVVYMLQLDEVTRQDYDDDGIEYLDQITTWPVAHCFDEFLTRIARFPNDTNAIRKAKTPEQDLPEITARFTEARQTAATQPFRRFFFDDGTLQKFWNIETANKQFTTYYGRFGNRPSATTKKYPNAAETMKASDKIIAQKLKKGYHEVLPNALSIKRPKKFRRATANAVKKFEGELGTTLPDQYRHFLETQNGGEPTPGYIAIPEFRYGDKVVEVSCLLGLYSDHNDAHSLHYGMEVAKRLLPKGHLVIACGSDLFTLSLKSKPGCVWYWDHESDDIYEDMSGANDRFRPSAAHLLSNSFEEFLTRIAMYRKRR